MGMLQSPEVVIKAGHRDKEVPYLLIQYHCQSNVFKCASKNVVVAFTATIALCRPRILWSRKGKIRENPGYLHGIMRAYWFRLHSTSDCRIPTVRG
jgi:hypothetical protein